MVSKYMVNSAGEIGDKFYILLEGTVSVEVPDPDYRPTPPPEEEEDPGAQQKTFKALPKRSMTLAYRRTATKAADENLSKT